MLHFAHRGIIEYENTIQGVMEVYNEKGSDMGVEIDVRFNTARDVVICHDRENRNEKENATLFQLLQSLDHETYNGKILMIDIKAFGIKSAKELARSIVEIIKRFPNLYENLQFYLCSFNEYCVSELLFICEDMNMINLNIGVITTGIPLGLYNHLENIDFVSIKYDILCEEVIQNLKNKRMTIFSWVVNDSSMKELMYNYNIDGLIYDVSFKPNQLNILRKSL
uniref:GP-PDE domain-containing protein n=1 Tax=viral metagenome TaxID=1070528 RepID=A0A6C0BPQ4_9ZZZZ